MPQVASCPPARQRGVTLIELMVSITLGMIIMAALLALYVNITRTNSEMAKSNRQIENGRFAIQVLQNDLVHAGFWGAVRPAAPTAIPDPCAPAAYNANLLAIPVQGIAGGGTLGTCATGGALADGDVLAVSHANTCVFGAAGCDGGGDTGPHIQVSGCTSAVPAEPTFIIDSATFPLRERNCATIAERRKLVTHLYYLADSNGQPTLMRSALQNGAFGAPQPLVEGIEAMRFEYGIDSNDDGSPDGGYVVCNPCNQAQLANIVAVKVHVLARNLEPTPGHVDNKTYQLGPDSFGPFNDNIKRHAFSTTVRLVNPSGRREMP